MFVIPTVSLGTDPHLANHNPVIFSLPLPPPGTEERKPLQTDKKTLQFQYAVHV